LRVWLSRWALDTEATASNSASQELPASGGMGICVNSTYDSGNIEVGSPGLSIPLARGSDSCPGASRCGAVVASNPAPPAATRRLAPRVPASTAPEARTTGRARTACNLTVAACVQVMSISDPNERDVCHTLELRIHECARARPAAVPSAQACPPRWTAAVAFARAALLAGAACLLLLGLSALMLSQHPAPSCCAPRARLLRIRDCCQSACTHRVASPAWRADPQ